jgi:hypothetical protein
MRAGIVVNATGDPLARRGREGELIIKQGCKNITFSATLPPDAGHGRSAQDDGKDLMPYRERPLGGRLSSTWLVLVVGLWIFLAILSFFRERGDGRHCCGHPGRVHTTFLGDQEAPGGMEAFAVATEA